MYFFKFFKLNQGKMKIKGNMAKATKFTPELFPKPTPENLAKYGAAKL